MRQQQSSSNKYRGVFQAAFMGSLPSSTSNNSSSRTQHMQGSSTPLVPLGMVRQLLLPPSSCSSSSSRLVLLPLLLKMMNGEWWNRCSVSRSAIIQY